MSAVAPVTNDILKENDTAANKKAQHKMRKRNKKKSKKQRQEEEAQRKAVSEFNVFRSRDLLDVHQKELEQQQSKDDALDDVQIEYVVQPVDMSALKNMDGMSNLDENTLQQFSDIFKHFQTGKPEEDDEVGG